MLSREDQRETNLYCLAQMIKSGYMLIEVDDLSRRVHRELLFPERELGDLMYEETFLYTCLFDLILIR